MTRIRTWVVAATTQSTNHYTITAVALTSQSSKKYHRIAINVNEKNFSPAGNRTPVFRVTGGDTHHYTTEEAMRYMKIKFVRFPSAYDHTTLNAPVLV